MSSTIPVIETDRLRLQGFSEADVAGWARLLYADPEVTRYLPGDWSDPLGRTQRYVRYRLDKP